MWTDEDQNQTTTSWLYDGLNRLVKEAYDGVDDNGSPLAYTQTFSFDFSSNRLTLTHDDRTPDLPASADGGAPAQCRHGAHRLDEA